jgi:hypothetical protein
MLLNEDGTVESLFWLSSNCTRQINDGISLKNFCTTFPVSEEVLLELFSNLLARLLMISSEY